MSISCAGVAIIRVWAAYIRVWAAIIHVQAGYTPRMLGAVGVCTAHLPRTYCVMYARRSHGDFFLTCSKFDGARSARGVCLAHLGDSTAYVWRTQSVNEDPRAYVAYLLRISYFFFRTPCQRSSIAGQWNGGITRAHLSSAIQLTQICIMYSIIAVYALPFRVASMPAVRYDLNGGLPTCLWYNSLYIRIIRLLLCLSNLC